MGIPKPKANRVVVEVWWRRRNGSGSRAPVFSLLFFSF
jgi:hypothetical protein